MRYHRRTGTPRAGRVPGRALWGSSFAPLSSVCLADFFIHLYFSLPDRIPLTRSGERRQLKMQINSLIASLDALPVVVREQLIERRTRRVVIGIQFSVLSNKIRC